MAIGWVCVFMVVGCGLWVVGCGLEIEELGREKKGRKRALERVGGWD